jgi:hypothetical protein
MTRQVGSVHEHIAGDKMAADFLQHSQVSAL